MITCKYSPPAKPLIATAPKYKIEVKFTNTYKNNQKTAIIKAVDSLYLVFKN